MNIGIIGVGRLGLAYALVFEQKGFNVFASSYKQDYVEQLSKKITDTNEPGIKEALQNSQNITFTTDNHQVIDACDILYVMVATPSNPDGDYDVTAVHEVANDLLEHKHDIKDKILVVGSTANPGTCADLQSKLDSRGVHVVYCPTFVAQGTVLKNIEDPHTMSIGTTNKIVGDKIQSLFSKICKDNTPVYQMSPTTAEILKLAGNCRATLMISWFNLIGQILIKAGMEQDITTASKYLNFVKLDHKVHFGFGYGGPCFPRDNKSFVHYAKTIDSDYSIGTLVDEFNHYHADFLSDFLISKNKDKLPYYFDHVSYKKGVNIMEESHQLAVCKKLLHSGFDV